MSMLTVSMEGNQAVRDHLVTNLAAIGTTRKPPKRPKRLTLTLQQYRLQVYLISSHSHKLT